MCCLLLQSDFVGKVTKFSLNAAGILYRCFWVLVNKSVLANVNSFIFDSRKSN